MASGFITLPDGSDWSRRYTGYDFVLETVMLELSDEGDEGVLKGWLRYILPDESAGDTESGYCFFKANGESVFRSIDTRLMKEAYAQIFWEKVTDLAGRLSGEDAPDWLIRELFNCYTNSLYQPYQPPVFSNTRREIFFLGGYAIAEGEPPPEDDPID